MENICREWPRRPTCGHLPWPSLRSYIFAFYSAPANINASQILTGSIPFSQFSFDAGVIVYVLSGGRPKRDLHISDDIWSMLGDCWNTYPNQRPSMVMIYRFFASKWTMIILHSSGFYLVHQGSLCDPAKCENVYTVWWCHVERWPVAVSISACDCCRMRRISCLDKPASLHRDRNIEFSLSKRLRTVSNSAISPASNTRTRS